MLLRLMLQIMLPGCMIIKRLLLQRLEEEEEEPVPAPQPLGGNDLNVVSDGMPSLTH